MQVLRSIFWKTDANNCFLCCLSYIDVLGLLMKGLEKYHMTRSPWPLWHFGNIIYQAVIMNPKIASPHPTKIPIPIYNRNKNVHKVATHAGFQCTVFLLVIFKPSRYNIKVCHLQYTFFFINNKKFKQSPRKSLIC